MSDERIVISVEDKVSSDIATKLRVIGSEARAAHASITSLKDALAAINTGGLPSLAKELKAVSSATLRAQLNQDKLTLSWLKNEAALSRAIAAAARAQQATIALANAKARAAAANAQLSTQTSNAAAANAQLSTQTSNAAAAASRASLAALKLSQAQSQVASSSAAASAGVGAFVRKLAGFAGVAFSVSSLAELADGYTILQNKLRNVASTEEHLNTITERVFQLAASTRTSVHATAQSFQRFDLALKNAGASQEETLRLTQTINEAIVTSGATTGEQTAALLQLSQAFNKGKLDGDEFRSVMELMPPVADAIAKQMGVVRGELLKLAPRGKITLDVMRKALAGVADEIDAKYARMVPTLGQAWTVLSDAAKKYIGEANKSLGITSGLSVGMLSLANNMGLAMAAATGLGAALLIVTGPAVLSGLAALGRGLWAATAALAANPVGLLVVALSAAVVGIAAFGDQVKLSADGLVTLKDAGVAAWEAVKTGAYATFKAVGDFGNQINAVLFGVAGAAGGSFGELFSSVLSFAKASVNSMIGLFVGAYRAVVAAWGLFPDYMRSIFVATLNEVVNITGNIINSVLEGLNTLAGIANKGANFLGLESIFDDKPLQVALDRYRVTASVGAADVGAAINGAFQDAVKTDYIGNALGELTYRARMAALDRRSGAHSGAADLRGPGATSPASAAVDGKAAKSAERRAMSLAKVNAQLDAELRGLYMLQPARDVQAKLDQIDINLASHKIKLSEQERASLLGKLKALQEAKQTQEAYDRVYQEATGAATQYGATLKASDILLAQGAISQEQHSQAVARAFGVYEEAALPLSVINRELKQQSDLLALVGPKQAEAQQMQQIENSLRSKGITLSAEQRAGLQKQISDTQALCRVNNELNRIYDYSIGAKQQIADQTAALTQAYANGYVNLDTYKNKLVQLGLAATDLKLRLAENVTFNDVATAGLGQLVSNYENAFVELGNITGSFLTTLADGFANSIGRAIVYAEDLKSAFTSVAQEAIAGLISALVKLGIQYVVMNVLGNSLAAASLATTAAAAALTATMWAPAAALASLATLGANVAPAQAGIVSSIAFTKMQAAISSVGFKEGGYTGNVGTKNIAGVVHGQEYVFDAASTKRIGVDRLEAIRRGASGVSLNSASGSASASGGVNVVIENYGTSKEFDVQRVSAEEVRIIARDEARAAVRRDAPTVVAGQLSNPNSTVSKALNNNTNTTRKRG